LHISKRLLSIIRIVERCSLLIVRCIKRYQLLLRENRELIETLIEKRATQFSINKILLDLQIIKLRNLLRLELLIFCILFIFLNFKFSYFYYIIDLLFSLLLTKLIYIVERRLLLIVFNIENIKDVIERYLLRIELIAYCRSLLIKNINNCYLLLTNINRNVN